MPPRRRVLAAHSLSSGHLACPALTPGAQPEKTTSCSPGKKGSEQVPAAKRASECSDWQRIKQLGSLFLGGPSPSAKTLNGCKC